MGAAEKCWRKTPRPFPYLAPAASGVRSGSQGSGWVGAAGHRSGGSVNGAAQDAGSWGVAAHTEGAPAAVLAEHAGRVAAPVNKYQGLFAAA